MTGLVSLTADTLFGGGLQLMQPASGHRAGTDAVLLTACLPSDATRIADLGAATGVVGLRAAQMNTGADIMLIERDPALVAIASNNVTRNGLEARVKVRLADAFALNQEVDLREAFDCVLTNPPYFRAENTRISPNANRAQSHVLDGSLSDWLRGVVTILAPRGRLVLIHRADAVGEILTACGRRLGAMRLRFVHPDAESAAIRVLVSGRKGSRAPTQILPPIILNTGGGRFTPEAAALHEGQARIDMETGGKTRPSRSSRAGRLP